MNLFILLSRTYGNTDYGWSSSSYIEPIDWRTTLLFFLLLTIPIIVLLIISLTDWDNVKNDIYYFINKNIRGRIKITDLPLSLKYILLNFGIKSRHITSTYRFNYNYLKKMDTYFAYEINTEIDSFHIYFNEIDNNSWFIYNKEHFGNEPVKIKSNYYDIIEKINNKLYENIKVAFHKRLKEQAFPKTI